MSTDEPRAPLAGATRAVAAVPPRLGLRSRARIAAGRGWAAATTSRWVGIRTDPVLVCTNTDAVTVRGAARYPTRPALWATGYYAELELTWAALPVWALTPGRTLHARKQLLGTTSAEEALRAATLAGQRSAQIAVNVASSLLGRPPSMHGAGALVVAVADGSVAAATLRPGDLIVAVDAIPVGTGPAAAAALADTGRDRVLRVHRIDQPDPVTVRVPAGQRAGVRLVTERPYESGGLDVRTGMPAGSVGPSAGLMLTLGVLDVLTPGELTGGAQVAGTGTIAPSGAVGEISGVERKVAAAADAGMDVFLAPVANAEQARAALARRRRRPRVYPVTDVRQALGVLAELGGAWPPPPAPASAALAS